MQQPPFKIAFLKPTKQIQIEKGVPSEFQRVLIPIVLNNKKYEYEKDLWNCLENAKKEIHDHLIDGQYESAMQKFGTMKETLFAFFDNVMINSDNADIRKNRLSLLVNIRNIAHDLADFSKL